MRPRRTHASNQVFRLPGGTEDNDLWVTLRQDPRYGLEISSTWQPTQAERDAIAAGANIELTVWGHGHPPVALGLTAGPLGKPPGSAA